MPTLTIKNIPDDLYAKLEEAAALHQRSLNSEVLAALERFLTPQTLDVTDLPAQARALRQKTAGQPATARQLAHAKTVGRP